MGLEAAPRLPLSPFVVLLQSARGEGPEQRPRARRSVKTSVEPLPLAVKFFTGQTETHPQVDAGTEPAPRTGKPVETRGRKASALLGSSPERVERLSKGRLPVSERRAAPRIQLLSHAFYWADRVEGRGELHDVSMTGARIEEASTPMKPGTKLRVTFGLNECGTAIQLWADVVRETETGFAVQFLEMDRLLREWLHRVTSAFDV